MGTGIYGDFGKTSGSTDGDNSSHNEHEHSESESMPNYEIAITPPEKFYNYSLDKDNPSAKGKAESYERGLGYNKQNADGLIKQIVEFVAAGNGPYNISASEYGIKYKFRIPVTGPNGKTKNVIAIYQIDKGESIPRMITNYLEGKND